jgi:hypothetical protein
MRPIVNGLKEQFDADVEFVYINAGAGEGKEIFDHLSLGGHPAFVVFSTDQQETFRAFGPVGETELRAAIRAQMPQS